VDDADGRGESIGDTTALESESTVVEVMFLLRNGLFAAGRLALAVEAMLLHLDRVIGTEEVYHVLRGRQQRSGPSRGTSSDTGGEGRRGKGAGAKGKKRSSEALSVDLQPRVKNFMWVRPRLPGMSS
jgi:hypothetical protein